MKTKTKIRKIPVSIFINILTVLENEGIEFIDIEVTHVSSTLDKIKIIAREDYQLAQENINSKFDENKINDIIA